MEETGAYLQADGKDEQDQAELLDEVEDLRIGPETEVAHEDADEQDPGGTEGYALDLEASEIDADAHDEGDQQDGMGNTLPQEQFSHSIRIPI